MSKVFFIKKSGSKPKTSELIITDSGVYTPPENEYYSKVTAVFEKQKLYTPTVSVNERVLTIDDSETNGLFTERYQIFVNGELAKTLERSSGTTLDLKTLSLSEGTYSITVKSCADKLEASDISRAVSYVVAPSGYKVTVDDSTGWGATASELRQSDVLSTVWADWETLGDIPVGGVNTFTVTKKYVSTGGDYLSCSGGITKVTNGNWDTFEVTGDGTIKIETYCLTGDTLVTMADYSTKRIDEIALGDYILSYDWETMMLVPNKVIYTDAFEHKSHTEYDLWTFSDGSFVKTVHRHRFFNVERKAFVYMDEWNIGEHTRKIDGTEPMLVSHETIKENVNHYKITGENGTNYFANGLLTGDRYCPEGIVFNE